MEERINAITLELSRINGELRDAKQEITSLKTRLSISEAKNKALTLENKKFLMYQEVMRR
jgi:regulator of replication initiation timing